MRRRHATAALLAVAALALATPAAAQADALQLRDEHQLFDWIRTFWPIVLVFGGMVVAAVMLGLGTRFASASDHRALRADFDVLKGQCGARELRLAALEKSLDASPTRSELQDDIAELGERMRAVEVGLTGVGGTLQTTNTYLHTLLEHHMERRG